MNERHCVYQHYLNSNIHKFVFLKADERGVDEFAVMFERMMREHESAEPILMLVDLRPDGIPPFNYTLKTIRGVFARFENPPVFRAGYLYEKSMFLAIMKRFFGLLGLSNQRRFFNAVPETAVLEWLLEGRTMLPLEPET